MTPETINQIKEALAPIAEKIGVGKEERRQARYGECLSSAWRQYSSAWDSQCKLAGKEADCTLPKYRYEPVEADYVREKEMCLAVLKAG